MRETPLIRCEDLGYIYTDDDGDPVEALRGVSLEIRKGEYIAVLGHNGSGKSTFAKLLNMILLPTSGKLFIDGQPIGEDIDEDTVYALRRRIGMVFQNPDNQLVATVVEEDVAFGPENLGVEPAQIRQRVDDALAAVGMTEYALYAPHRLSGGQKQRVAIAGILAMLPECIIFDESTAMLDPSGREEILRTMEMLNRDRGITVLNITHHMDEAVRADRVIVINDGRLSADGTPETVFSDMPALRKMGLEAPQATELLYELDPDGAMFSLPCLDAEECASRILAEYHNHISGKKQGI